MTSRCKGHESLTGPAGVTVYCDGSCEAKAKAKAPMRLTWDAVLDRSGLMDVPGVKGLDRLSSLFNAYTDAAWDPESDPEEVLALEECLEAEIETVKARVMYRKLMRVAAGRGMKAATFNMRVEASLREAGVSGWAAPQAWVAHGRKVLGARTVELLYPTR